MKTISPSVELPQVCQETLSAINDLKAQPECYFDKNDTYLFDCGNWEISASWEVPADAVSGVYFGRLVITDQAVPTWRTDNR